MEIYTVGRIRDCTDTIKLNICMVLENGSTLNCQRDLRQRERHSQRRAYKEQEYGVHFHFCHPNEAGAKVVELLEGGL